MKEDENKSKLMGTKEFANYWGISKWMVYDLVEDGRLKPITGMGKGWKFFASDFESIALERI